MGDGVVQKTLVATNSGIVWTTPHNHNLTGSWATQSHHTGGVQPERKIRLYRP